MSEAKHTPGPWINDNGLVYGTSCDGTQSFDIYDADEWPGYVEQAQANAKLIAAAPDMLEALQTVLSGISRIPEDVLDEITFAIRKATQ